MFTLSWLPIRLLAIMNCSNGLLDARYLRTFYSSPLNVVYFTMMLMSRQCFFLGHSRPCKARAYMWGFVLSDPAAQSEQWLSDCFFWEFESGQDWWSTEWDDEAAKNITLSTSDDRCINSFTLTGSDNKIIPCLLHVSYISGWFMTVLTIGFSLCTLTVRCEYGLLERCCWYSRRQKHGWYQHLNACSQHIFLYSHSSLWGLHNFFYIIGMGIGKYIWTFTAIDSQKISHLTIYFTQLMRSF